MSLLSSLSVTIPLDGDFSVRAVSPTGCRLSPEHIIPDTRYSLDTSRNLDLDL